MADLGPTLIIRVGKGQRVLFLSGNWHCDRCCGRDRLRKMVMRSVNCGRLRGHDWNGNLGVLMLHLDDWCGWRGNIFGGINFSVVLFNDGLHVMMLHNWDGCGLNGDSDLLRLMVVHFLNLLYLWLHLDRGGDGMLSQDFVKLTGRGDLESTGENSEIRW